MGKTRDTVATARRKRGPSFRLKVTLVASLFAVIPLLAVGFIVENVNERALVDANQETLAVVVGNVSGAAGAMIERADTTLGMVADVLVDTRLDSETRIALAQRIVTGSKLVTAIGVYDQKGARIDVVETTAKTSLPMQLPPALIGPLVPAFGAVTFADHHAFIQRARIMKGAAETWTLVAQMQLDPLAERVAELGLTNNVERSLFVVDSDLDIIADTTREKIGNRITANDAGAITAVSQKIAEKGVLLTGEFKRGDGERVLGELRTIDQTPLAVIVEIPRSQAYHSITAVRRIVLVATLLAILIAIVAGVIFGQQLTKPIRALVSYAGELASRKFDRRMPHKTSDELGVLGDALEQAATELAESDEKLREEAAIRSDLGRYLPMKLVDQIVARERSVALGGERREVTVLFADVVGFTPLAERQPAEVVVTMLNELFTILTEIVFRHGGTVDKFVGDCVMAMWGAPDDQPDHAKRALAAAEDMHRWLEAGNESWRERFGFGVELAIGVNTGEAVVGNFGSETRMEYTVIGDVVNVAARLESIARPNQILITAGTRTHAGTGFRYRALGSKALAGKSEAVELYEVLP